MSKQKSVANFYKKKQIESATPMQLVLLLYDGAIDNLYKAEQAIESDKSEALETFHNHLVNCQNIITELTVALDMEKGGEIATKLFQLYDYMNYRLANANVQKDVTMLREVSKLLTDLRTSWQKVAEQEHSLKEGGAPPKPNSGLNLQG